MYILFLFLSFLPLYLVLFWMIVLSMKAFRGNTEKGLLSYFFFASLIAILGQVLFFNRMYSAFQFFYAAIFFFGYSQYPAFYLYIRYLTKKDFSWKLMILHHIVPFMVSLIIAYAFYIRHSSDARYEIITKYIGKALHTDELFYTTHLLDHLFRNLFLLYGVFYFILMRKNLTKYHNQLYYYFSNNAYRLNWLVIFNYIFLIFTIWAFILFNIKNNFFYKEPSQIISLIPSILFSVLYFIVGYIGSHQKLIDIQPVYQAESDFNNKKIAISQENLTVLKQKLIEIMINEKPYLNPDITLNDLSRLLCTNRSYLSVLLKNEFSMNFNSFINEHRINALIQLKSIHKEPSIKELSIKAGFLTYSTFYRAFREKKGISPDAFFNNIAEEK